MGVKMDITPPTTFTFLLFSPFTLHPLPWEGRGGYFTLLLFPFLFGCEVTAFYWKSQIHFAVTWKNCNFAADSSFYSHVL